MCHVKFWACELFCVNSVLHNKLLYAGSHYWFTLSAGNRKVKSVRLPVAVSLSARGLAQDQGCHPGRPGHRMVAH